MNLNFIYEYKVYLIINYNYSMSVQIAMSYLCQ